MNLLAPRPPLGKALAPGTRLGHYCIVEQIGVGGMGEVYRAHDSRLGRDVALKVLKAVLAADPEQLRRFEQEARTAGSLAHPNLLAVHDVGTHEGVRFIVFELLHGRTLRDLLDEGPVPPARALELAREMAEGLAAAHGRGVFHRDVKPENVFITESGHVKLLDFGLSRFGREAASGFEPSESEPSRVMGSLGYLAPEQVAGQEADQRADLFAVGAILYEMLAGHRAFDGVNSRAVMRATLSAQPPRLAAVPGPVAEAVARCLEKSPAARFQSAAELSRALRALAHPALPASRGARLRLLALSAFALVLLAILAAQYFARRKPAAHFTVAVADFDNATGEADLDGLSGMLITALEQSQQLSVMTRSRMFDLLRQVGRGEVRRVDEVVGRELCKNGRCELLVLASIQRFGALYTIDLKVLDAAADRYVLTARAQGTGKQSVPALIDQLSEETRKGLHERADEIGAALSPVARTTTANLEAYRHYFEGEQRFARGLYREAADELQQAVGLDPGFALARFWFSEALAWSTSRATAQRELEAAMSAPERLPPRERCLGEAVLQLRDPVAAVRLMRRCAARFPLDKLTLFLLADFRFHCGDVAGSIEGFEQVLAIDPTFAPAVEHLLSAWQTSGHAGRMVALARAYAERTRLAEAEVALAHAWLAVGEPERAEETLRNAETRGGSLALALGRVKLHLAAGEVQKAEAALARLPAARDDGERRLIREHRLAVDESAGRIRAVLAALDDDAAAARAAQVGGDLARALVRKASVLVQVLGDVPAARQVEAELRALDPQGGELFELLLQQGDLDAAEAALPKGREAPSFTEQRLAEYRALARAQTPELLERADAVLSRSAAPLWFAAQDKLEELDLRGGQVEKAIAVLQRLQATVALPRDWSTSLFSGARLALRQHQLGLASELAGRPAAAAAAYQRFLKMWSGADADLPEVQHARTRLAALEAPE